MATASRPGTARRRSCGRSPAAGGAPAECTLEAATGVLGGTAAGAGAGQFIVRATDALGDTATAALSLTVSPGPPASLAFAAGPNDVVAGVAISPAVQVRVVD